MNSKKTLITTGAGIASFLTLASTAFAQTTINPCPAGSNFNNLCGIDQTKLSTIVSTGVIVLLVLTVLVALTFLIWGGIRWITSGGDKTKVEGARNTIIAAIVGLVIAFLAYFILNVVGTFFNIQIFNLAIPHL